MTEPTLPPPPTAAPMTRRARRSRTHPEPLSAAPCDAPVLTLRVNQTEGDAALRAALPLGRGMIKMPCGTGKTKLALYSAQHFRNMLFVTHSEELIDSTYDAAQSVWPGHRVGIIRQKEFDLDARFVIASLQTLQRRLKRVPPGHFDLVVMDEAHLSGARLATKTVRHFQPRFLLGLSATPERHTDTSLHLLYGQVIYQMSTQRAIAEGLIVPVRALSFNLHLKPPETVRQGDYAEDEAVRVINTPSINQVIAEETRANVGARSTLVFAVTVDHARQLARALGPGAEAVWGDDAQREMKIERFRRGETQFLVSARVVSFGFDAPIASAAVLAFMTLSPTRFTQTVGRLLRTNPGKDHGLLLDFGGNLARGLRIEKDWEFQVTHIDRAPDGSGERPFELNDDQPWTDQNVTATHVSVDALGPPAAVHVPAGRGLATDAQRNCLKRFGYRVPDELSRTLASALIAWHPATPAQLQALTQRGYRTDVPWGSMQARAALSPQGVAPPAAGTLPSPARPERARSGGNVSMQDLIGQALASIPGSGDLLRRALEKDQRTRSAEGR